ncbi:MAG TPA: hypothetical protein VIR27_15430 [Mycobacteriales bacterium]|jgi:hypothetical protein
MVPIGASLVGITALLIVSAGPADADPSASTTVTFAVTAATLDITAPATATLTNVAPGDTATGSLADTVVTDGRAATDASWTATVLSTAFTSGSQSIPASDVRYSSGSPTATTGNGAFNAGATVTPDATAPEATAFSHTGGTGNNTSTWSPTLSVIVPLGTSEGTFTGTVTQSVA